MTYDQAINSASVVLVEFYASWCPHCQRMMPIVEQVKDLVAGQAAVFQYDIDRDPKDASEQTVQSLPTFLLYHNGRQVWRHEGEIPGQVLVSKIEALA